MHARWILKNKVNTEWSEMDETYAFDILRTRTPKQSDFRWGRITAVRGDKPNGGGTCRCLPANGVENYQPLSANSSKAKLPQREKLFNSSTRGHPFRFSSSFGFGRVRHILEHMDPSRLELKFIRETLRTPPDENIPNRIMAASSDTVVPLRSDKR